MNPKYHINIKPQNKKKTTWLFLLFISIIAYSFPIFSQETSITLNQVQKVRSQIQNTVQHLANQATKEKIKWRANQLTPTLLLNLNLSLQGTTPLEQASSFLKQYKACILHEVKVFCSITSEASIYRKLFWAFIPIIS